MPKAGKSPPRHFGTSGGPEPTPKVSRIQKANFKKFDAQMELAGFPKIVFWRSWKVQKGPGGGEDVFAANLVEIRLDGVEL